jgi:hypothetical protein
MAIRSWEGKAWLKTGRLIPTQHSSLDYMGKYLFTCLTRCIYLSILKLHATPLSPSLFSESCRLFVLETVDSVSHKCDTGLWSSLHFFIHHFLYLLCFIFLYLYVNAFLTFRSWIFARDPQAWHIHTLHISVAFIVVTLALWLSNLFMLAYILSILF